MGIKRSRCLIAADSFFSVLIHNLVTPKFEIFDVAADGGDTYVLVPLEKPGAERGQWEIQVRKNTGDLPYKFPVKRGDMGWVD